MNLHSNDKIDAFIYAMEYLKIFNKGENKMNYSNEIFKILGIKPGEEFKVDKTDCIYKLDGNLRLMFKYHYNEWEASAYELADILTGQLSIIKIVELTKEEQTAVDYAKLSGFKWLAKDKNGDSYAFTHKPTKNDVLNYWETFDVDDSTLTEILIPLSFLSWEDEEPYYIGD